MAKKLRQNTRVFVARKALDISQEQLCKRTGLVPNDIVRIERYGWIPPKDMRSRIARELRTTVAALFGDAVKELKDLIEAGS